MDDDKCLNCDLSNFGNFHYKIDDLKGGELFVLEESISQNKILPCQLIYPLDPGFNLWREVYRSLQEMSIEELDDDKFPIMPPMLYFFWQSLFDLKASAFLALAAHYRSATQLLKPILENIIISKYFQERIKRSNDENEWEKEYENFIEWSNKTDHPIDFNNCLGYLNDKYAIITDGEEDKRVKELWDKLNKYVHSYIFRWDKGDSPEIVCYDEGLFNEWLDWYQNILSYLIETLCYYFPEEIRTQNGQNALIEIKGMESLEKDCEITLIKSNYLRNFLSQISPDGNLPKETGLPCSLFGLPGLDENIKP